MSEMESLGDLESQLEAVEMSAAQAGQMVAGFDGELQRLRGGLQHVGGDLATFERGMQRGFRRAIDGVVKQGDSLGDALKNIVSSVISTAYSAAVNPVADHLGSMLAGGVGRLFGVLPFENGAPFSQGPVMPFANGGVVSGPVPFPMRGGMGVVGEAGPEAIMPLARGADGKLGVRASAGTSINISIHVSTPDVAGFQRSQGQIAAQVSRAISRGQRNM
ncbi:phage tail tape measure protein [Cognatishimia sp.]|uniref:phage tail tape measure protein n=1 Tax=Cognatishimia sp. TaxID=2211648 RepID=UPI00351109E1